MPDDFNRIPLSLLGILFNLYKNQSGPIYYNPTTEELLYGKNPLAEASRGAVPLRANPPPQEEEKETSSSSLRDEWKKAYKYVTKQEVEDKIQDVLKSILAGDEMSQKGPISNDLSSFTPSFTSADFWGGFTPSFGRSTGSFLGDLTRGIQNAMSSLSSFKDFAKYGIAMFGMPFGPAIATLGFLNLTEKSSLNPVNNSMVREALMEAYNQSPVAKSIFGSAKTFEGFLGGMFGYGSSFKGIKEPKNLSSFYNELLGYVPNKAQIESMRTEALDTVRGLSMALTNWNDFKAYTTTINTLREEFRDVFGSRYPTFSDFARAMDIAHALNGLQNTLSLSPKEVAIAKTVGLFETIRDEAWSDPAKIAQAIRDEANKQFGFTMSARVSDFLERNIDDVGAMKAAIAIQEAINEARNNPALSVLDLARENLSKYGVPADIQKEILEGLVEIETSSSSGVGLNESASGVSSGAGMGASGGLSIDFGSIGEDKDKDTGGMSGGYGGEDIY